MKKRFIMTSLLVLFLLLHMVYSDTVNEWLGKGIELQDSGNLEEALDAFDMAIEIDPGIKEAWYYRGNVLDRLSRFEEAVDAYDKAIEIEPDFMYAWYNKGVDLAILGRYEEALAAYERSIEVDEDFTLAWNSKGNALADLGRYREAADAYQKAIELDPTFLTAVENKDVATRLMDGSPATRIVILANSIDYSLANDFFVFLRNGGIAIMRVTASNFDEYRQENFIVILGGPDAPEGVGEIVQNSTGREVLTPEEQNEIRAEGNRKMYAKTDIWSQGQVIMVIAGSDRYGTQMAHLENREEVVNQVKPVL